MQKIFDRVVNYTAVSLTLQESQKSAKVICHPLTLQALHPPAATMENFSSKKPDSDLKPLGICWKDWSHATERTKQRYDELSKDTLSSRPK